MSSASKIPTSEDLQRARVQSNIVALIRQQGRILAAIEAILSNKKFGKEDAAGGIAIRVGKLIGHMERERSHFERKAIWKESGADLQQVNRILEAQGYGDLKVPAYARLNQLLADLIGPPASPLRTQLESEAQKQAQKKTKSD